MTKRRLLLLFAIFLVYLVLAWLLAFLVFADSPLLVGVILSVCGLTLLLVYILVARLTSKLSNTPAAASTPEPSPPAASKASGLRDDDVDSISSLIAEANDRLMKSPRLASSKVRPSVTSLPLYLLLGAEGSGKSSLFLASELDPELLAGEAYRDSAIVPTRILNLWFGAGCIIAEASGRFFSEEPGRLGRLVGMLLGKRGMPLLAKLFSRPQHGQRMKGVVLCCPIDSFVGVPDANQQAAFVRRVQERLKAIGETLGMDFPVYVVFTKCDAIPYFAEYFSRLVEIEDQQVLGCTLPVAAVPDGRSQTYADVQTKRISEYFNRLYSSLGEHRMTFLRRETERAKKPPVYEFPRELKRIRGTVVPFLVDLFRPNPLQPGPLLRGFYFTGSRRVPATEAAASRMKSNPTTSPKLGEATRLFRLEDLQKTSLQKPPAEDSGLVTVWSFAGDLFHQIIVSDRDRISGAFVDRRLDRYRRLLFGSVVFVCLLLSIIFVRSWFGNRALLSSAQIAAAGVKTLGRPGDTPSPDNLQEIENLRSVLRKVSDNFHDGAPWKLRFGLYAGNRIYPALRDVYFQRFREYFLGDTVRGVEAKLGRLPAAQSPAFEYKAVFDDLKGYRTITTSDERGCSPDNEFTQWLMGSWRGTDLAERQFRFYVDELRAKRNPYPDLRSVPAAVKNGRSYLAAYSGIDPLYQGIVSSVNEELSSTAKLSDYTQRAPDTLVLMAGSEIPSAFTHAGFNLVEKKIASAGRGTVGNPCVLGFGQSFSGLLQGSDTSQQLMNRYIREYIDRWKKFLAATTIQNYKNPADAAHKLDFLSSNGSPLLAVLAMVAENTQFPSNSPTPDSGLLNRVETHGKRNFLDKLRGHAPAAVKDAIPKVDPQEVLGPQKIAQVFQPARAVFQTPNRSRLVDDVNAKYIAALADLQVAMAALGEQSDPQSNVELNKTANDKAQAGLRLDRELTLKFDSSPEAVSDLVGSFLDEPFKQAEKFIVADSAKAANAKLEGGLRDLCSKLHPILRKYPFSALNEQETDLPELRSMFSPASGAFWNFHRQYTAKLLEKRGHQWFLKADAETKLTDRFLSFFNKMAAVSDALFPPDGETPQAQFTLSLPSPQGYQSVSGTVDGEDFATAPKPYFWPGQQPGVNLRVVLTGTISTTFARYGGLWGLFRWMQSAEERPGGTATFGFINQSRASRGSQPQPILENGMPIRIQVNEFPGKIDTVFDRDFFTGIDCPAHATE